MLNKCNNPIVSEIVLTALKLKGISTGHKNLLLHSEKLEDTTNNRAAEFAGERFLLYYDFESEGVHYKGYLGIDKELNLVSISELKPIEKDHYIVKQKTKELIMITAHQYIEERLFTPRTTIGQSLQFKIETEAVMNVRMEKHIAQICSQLSYTDIDSLLFCIKKNNDIGQECPLREKKDIVLNIVKDDLDAYYFLYMK